MFTPFWFDKEDMKNVLKLQKSKLKSRKVVGRGTLIADAREIRSSQGFKNNLELMSKIIDI